MENIAPQKPKTSMGQLVDMVKRRRLYFLGIILGLILIFVNAYIGLFVVTSLLEQKEISAEQGIALPLIREDIYSDVKEDLVQRGTRVVTDNVRSDIFFRL